MIVNKRGLVNIVGLTGGRAEGDLTGEAAKLEGGVDIMATVDRVSGLVIGEEIIDH
jgi:hypothetical protein